MEENKKIAERIAHSIQKSNLTYRELSKLTGVPSSTLQRYASGQTEKLPIDKLELIAKATKVSPAYLMGWEDGENNKSPPEKKEKTTPVEDGLSDAQRALIQFARTVPEEKAELILRVMKSILEDD